MFSQQLQMIFQSFTSVNVHWIVKALPREIILLCFCLGNYIADKFIAAIMKYTLIHSFTSNIASQLDIYLSISFIHLTFTFYFFSFLFECYIFLTKNLLFTISVGMPENLNGNNFEYYLHIVSNFLLVDETYINI